MSPDTPASPRLPASYGRPVFDRPMLCAVWPVRRPEDDAGRPVLDWPIIEEHLLPEGDVLLEGDVLISFKEISF